MPWLSPRPEHYPDLDERYLDRLAAHLGHGTVRELLADGLIGMRDLLERAERQAQSGDAAGLARTTHTLIGLSGQLGLLRLSLTAAELEAAARVGGARLDTAALAADGSAATAAVRARLGAG